PADAEGNLRDIGIEALAFERETPRSTEVPANAETEQEAVRVRVPVRHVRFQSRMVIARLTEEPHVADVEAAHERELVERFVVTVDLLRDGGADAADAGAAEPVQASVLVEADFGAPPAECVAGLDADHRRAVLDYAVEGLTDREVGVRVAELQV